MTPVDKPMGSLFTSNGNGLRNLKVEAKTDKKLNCLRELYRRLRSGTNIVLLCFCKDYNYCHRKLVAEFFKQYEMIAEELDPIKHEQLILFS
ncbi:MAG: DUF488 family protein, N3 subclade [Desulfitobacteriaceae bacterium]